MTIKQSLYFLSDREIIKKIGEKIRYLRLRQNITQQQLAEDTQLSLSTIKKIERGEGSTLDSFLRILRILGRLDDLSNLVEEEGLSPVEYYEMTQILKKKERKRASKSK